MTEYKEFFVIEYKDLPKYIHDNILDGRESVSNDSYIDIEWPEKGTEFYSYLIEEGWDTSADILLRVRY